MNDLEGFISIVLRRNFPTFDLTIDGEMSVTPQNTARFTFLPNNKLAAGSSSFFLPPRHPHWRGTAMLYGRKGSHDGVQHSGLLGFWTSFIVRYSKSHSVRETGSVFILR
jgi:hypothetical protein